MTIINSINNLIPDNNFSSSFSKSGVAITETITQTSNTALSTASQIISVAGTSSANPYLAISPDGTNQLAIGAITSATPVFSMSYGASATPASGTQLMQITPTGYVTKPHQPAFLAYVTNDTAGVTGDGTNYYIISLTSVFDQGSNFNVGTGIFTAPIAGTYVFGINVYASGFVANNKQSYLTIRTTIIDTVSECVSNWYNIRVQAAPYYVSGNCEQTCKMSAGDTCRFLIAVTSNSSKNVVVTGTNSWVWGFLKS